MAYTILGSNDQSSHWLKSDIDTSIWNKPMTVQTVTILCNFDAPSPSLMPPTPIHGDPKGHMSGSSLR